MIHELSVLQFRVMSVKLVSGTGVMAQGADCQSFEALSGTLTSLDMSHRQFGLQYDLY